MSLCNLYFYLYIIFFKWFGAGGCCPAITISVGQHLPEKKELSCFRDNIVNMSKLIRLGLALKGKEAKKFEEYLSGPKTITPFMQECMDDVVTHCYSQKE